MEMKVRNKDCALVVLRLTERERKRMSREIKSWFGSGLPLGIPVNKVAFASIHF